MNKIFCGGGAPGRGSRTAITILLVAHFHHLRVSGRGFLLENLLQVDFAQDSFLDPLAQDSCLDPLADPEPWPWMVFSGSKKAVFWRWRVLCWGTQAWSRPVR
ncbi:unnamed protein product [Amoebophrya sp. A120]|nr:unnamed protein product [Amoebophrya sp. A120]|eukprot:GSA120T00013644001.1